MGPEASAAPELEYSQPGGRRSCSPTRSRLTETA